VNLFPTFSSPDEIKSHCSHFMPQFPSPFAGVTIGDPHEFAQGIMSKKPNDPVLLSTWIEERQPVPKAQLVCHTEHREFIESPNDWYPDDRWQCTGENA